MATNTFSFTSPTDIITAQQQLERQRRMAEMLQQQAMEQDGNSQVVSGWVVNDALGKGISKLGSALMARNALNRADESAKDFGQARTAFAQKAFEDFQNEITPRTLGDGEAGPRYNPTPADVSKAQARLLMNLGGDPMESAKLMASAATQDAQRARLLQMFTPQPAINAPQATNMALSETAAAGMPGPTNQAAVRQFELYGQRQPSPNNPNNVPPEMLVDAYIKDPIKAIELTTPKYSQTPQYDQKGRAFVMDERGNLKYLDGVSARTSVKIAPNGVAYDEYATKPGTTFNDVNKPFSIGPDGQMLPNKAYIDYEMSKAERSRTSTNVNVRVDNKMADSLATQVGPMMEKSTTNATAAIQSADAANRIMGALDTNKVWSGPLSNIRMGAAQLASTLNIAGKDTQEQIANTRNVIKGLAELTLEGRKSMRGEGQITDSESKLAERAKSGDPTELTPAEIRIIANAARRTAEFQHGEHRRKLDAMRTKPNLTDLIPYYEVPDLPAAYGGAAPVKPNGSGWAIREKP